MSTLYPLPSTLYPLPSTLPLIIRREYLFRVRKKSFLLLTLLTPLLMIGMIFVPLWLASFRADDVRTVAVIDHTGHYAPLFTDTDGYRFVTTRTDDPFATLEVTDDLLRDSSAATLYSRQQIPADLSRLVNETLRQRMEHDKMAAYGIPNLEQIVRESHVDYQIRTVKLNDDGSESTSSTQLAYIIGIVFTLAVYMFITLYGSMVMQGVSEEKTNRIVELMVSSVRPFDLMAGKIIGIGLVGLTQLLLWGVLTLVGVGAITALTGAAVTPTNTAAAPADVAQTAEWMAALSSFNLPLLLLSFAAYFVGGYLLYASLFAAIGSVIDHPEDAQQFMMPVMMVLIFALYAGIYSLDNPDGPLAFWCSLIPLTSPVVMMMRLPFDIPLWQPLLSIALLYATALGVVWLSGRIYRVGILLYGKKPNLKEIVKWIGYR